MSADHLSPSQIAAYVDGVTDRDERARIQAHLALCEDCRAEAVEVSRIVRTAPTASVRVSRRLWVPAAAVAALLLLWVGRESIIDRSPAEHRDEAVTTTVAPRPVTPIGGVDTVRALIWSSVPHADRYRVRLFDADGSLLWEREVAETTAVPPATVALRAGQPYFWRVEARTGFDRWAASDLIEFVPRQRGRR